MTTGVSRTSTCARRRFSPSPQTADKASEKTLAGDDPDRPVTALDPARTAAGIGEPRLEQQDLLAVEVRRRRPEPRHSERQVPRAHLVVDEARRLRPVHTGVIVVLEVT